MAKKTAATKRLCSDRLVRAFNEQIGNELFNSHQYLAMAAHFSNRSLNELGKFFRRQFDEEREHALKLVRFLTDAGEAVEVPALAKPKATFRDPLEAAEMSLAWERNVTQRIYDLVAIARADRNEIALRFLDWFVTEQLEETSLMETLVDVVRMAGSNLLDLERYLAQYGNAVAPSPFGTE